MRCLSGAQRRSWQVVHAAMLVLGLAACSRPDHNSNQSGDDDDDTVNEEGYLEPGTGVLDIAITLEESAGIARDGEPVRSGVPVPRALQLKDASRVVVVDESGVEHPTQVMVTSRWGGAPDDASLPIKWLLVDFQTDVEAGTAESYRLRTRKSDAPSVPALAQESSDAILIDTGAATFAVSRSRFDLFSSVTLADGTVLAGANGGIVLTAPGGGQFLAANGTTEVSIEENGPVRSVLVARGKHEDASGTALLDFTVRMHFFAGRTDSLVSYTFTDRDLPSIRSFSAVDEAALTIPAQVGESPRFTFGGAQDIHAGALAGEAFLRQTGGLSAAMASSFNPGNADSITYALGGAAAGNGGHAPGWVDLSGSKGGVTAAVRWFWQQYPKKLAVRADALDVVLWPREEADMRVYAASQKTHEVLFSFHAASEEGAAIGRAQAARLANPLFARCDPSWYAKSWVWNKIGTANLDDYAPEHQQTVQRYFDNMLGVEYPMTFRDLRFDGDGAGHAYSMWDFGDGREHYWSNLAYDTPRSLLIHWAITGDRELLEDGLVTLQHLRDVDIEHSPLDTRAGIRNARAVSKPWLGRTRYTPSEGPQSHDLGHPGSTFGFEHHKGQSLADHWFLTGDRLSKEVLAESYHYYEQWKVDADNGFHRTGGSRVVSHMLLVVLAYQDAYGTAESRERVELIVRFLDEWQREKSSKDPDGMMWNDDGDSTSTFMNAVTAEALSLYETTFPDGRPVRQNLIDAAAWTIDTKNGQLASGSGGKYFNAWTGHNYGVSHATVLDPMMGPMLGYAGHATGDPNYAEIGKEVLVNCIEQDRSTPYIKAFTQQTRLVPAFLYYLQTEEARRE